MDLRSYLREHGADDCTRPLIPEEGYWEEEDLEEEPV